MIILSKNMGIFGDFAKMEIATFNVNSLRARLGIVIDWLDKNEPDVLCVQETKVQDKDFPYEAFAGSGYGYVYRGQKSYNGVAVFAKGEIEDVVFGLDDEPYDEARLVRAKVGGVWIVNSYVPQGFEVGTEKYEYKLEWFRRLRKYFEKHFKQSDQVIWVGDFNVAMEDIDIYDPDGLRGHVCFNEQVQKALREVMDWGFVDVFRRHCKEAGQYSFWDYRMRGGLSRNRGWRLDYIMVTKSLSQSSKGCYIDKRPRLLVKPSDHTPVVAEFDI